MKTKEIHDDMVKTLGEDSPCYYTVKKWVADLKRGRESTDNDERTGRQKTATTNAQVDGIRRMVINDRHVTVKDIAEALCISAGSVHTALTGILGMSKLPTRWVPRMLTPDQKLNRLELSRAFLTRFLSDPANFLKRIVTQDKTWVHHFSTE